MATVRLRGDAGPVTLANDVATSPLATFSCPHS